MKEAPGGDWKVWFSMRKRRDQRLSRATFWEGASEGPLSCSVLCPLYSSNHRDEGCRRLLWRPEVRPRLPGAALWTRTMMRGFSDPHFFLHFSISEIGTYHQWCLEATQYGSCGNMVVVLQMLAEKHPVTRGKELRR